jgi:uncharacterized Zn finger protein
MKCYKCGGKMEEHVELVIHNGKTVPQQVQKCRKCGATITHIDEYEKVRKQIHPSFFNRVKECFSKKIELVDTSKGKLL